MEVNCQIQVLYSAFYRNKTAYIIGKTVNGYQETPFAIAVRHNARGLLYLDADPRPVADLGAVLAVARLLLVDMEVPSGYVQFLRSIMPNKPRRSSTPCSAWASRARRCSSATWSRTCATRTTSSSSRRASAAW